jgi:histone H3/H4
LQTGADAPPLSQHVLAGLVDTLIRDPRAQKLLIERLSGTMACLPSAVPSQDLAFCNTLWRAMVPVADELCLQQIEEKRREDAEEIVKGYPTVHDEDDDEGIQSSSDDDDDSSEVSRDDVDDLLSDSEVEETFVFAFENYCCDPAAEKALRQTYRDAIRCGPIPTPDTSSLPMVAEFTSQLIDTKRCNLYDLQWWDSDEDEDEEEAEAREAADDAEDDADFVQESLVEMFHDAAAEFSCEFDNELGLGCKRPMTLRLHEQVEALRQVKLRVEETESGDGQQLADVDDVEEFLDGVDDALDSRDRIARKLNDVICVHFKTLYSLQEHVPEGQMNDRIYGCIDDDFSNHEDLRERQDWLAHDDDHRLSFSDYVDRLQALESKLRAFLDELSACDSELHNKRIAFELEETALAEIRFEQRDTRTIINRQSFSLLCREILESYKTNARIDDEALDALQAAAESRVIEVFEKANLVAIHAQRTFVEPRDFHVVYALEACQPL